jgi:membrane-associated phospholipid phosphatase
MQKKATKTQIYEWILNGASRLQIFNLLCASVILAVSCISTPAMAGLDLYSTTVNDTSLAAHAGVRDSSKVQNATSIDATLGRSAQPGLFDPITNLPSDWQNWATYSFRAEHWPVFGAVAASTAAMIVYDNEMWLPFKKMYESNSTVAHISDGFVFMGDGKFQFGLAAAFAGYGAVFGDKKALRTASQTAEVILACGAVVQLLKHVTGRESPIVTTSPTGVWKFFPNQIEYHKHVPHYDAFPSGHLATATATLTVIANNYPDVTWIKPVGYVFLAGIATGLVATSIHWWSDFPLALAIGYGFGKLISPSPVDAAVLSQAPNKDVGQTTIQFYPAYADGAPGVGMRVDW